MKTFGLLFIFLILSCFLLAQPLPEWDWAVRAGGVDYDEGISVATDHQGNCYITGYFEGQASFGGTTLINKGIFIAKLDADGNWIWVKDVIFQPLYSGSGRGICVDDSANVYVVGQFSGNSFFGATNLTSTGGSDLFVAKLDSNGNWLWAVAGGGSTSADVGYHVTVDANSNVYVSGTVGSTDAVFGTIPLTTAGGSDVLIAKLDTNGNWLWAVRAGGSIADIGDAIVTDPVANVYVTGSFQQTATFGTTDLTSAGGYDIFVAKLDTNGNWIWAIRAGGTNTGIQTDRGFGIVTDSTDNIYITGVFRVAATFGTINLTSAGLHDVFVAKLDSNANWLWAVNAGGTGTDRGYGIALDSEMNIFVTGHINGSAEFGSITLNGTGDDIFTAKLSNSGNWLWALNAGGTGSDYGEMIAVDIMSNIYVTGRFSVTANFGDNAIVSSGNTDVFIAKILQIEPVDNDMAAIIVSGETNPSFGVASLYQIEIRNIGTNPQDDYTVKLMQEGDIEIASVVGMTLSPQTTMIYDLSWTPTTSGATYLYGKVVLVGDENPTNDQTPNLNVVVQSLGSIFTVVNDMQNAPIANATVTCGSTTGTTDSQGVCVIQVGAGIHSVTASHPDYISITQNGVEVLVGEMTFVSFQLAPTSIDHPSVTVFSTALLGNQPNPFKTNTSIQYCLKDSSPVSISIYNLKGKLVRTLIQSNKNSGQHNIVWDGRDENEEAVSAGLYYYKLSTPQGTQTRKMLLLK